MLRRLKEPKKQKKKNNEDIERCKSDALWDYTSSNELGGYTKNFHSDARNEVRNTVELYQRGKIIKAGWISRYINQIQVNRSRKLRKSKISYPKWSRGFVILYVLARINGMNVLVRMDRCIQSSDLWYESNTGRKLAILCRSMRDGCSEIINILGGGDIAYHEPLSPLMVQCWQTTGSCRNYPK